MFEAYIPPLSGRDKPHTWPTTVAVGAKLAVNVAFLWALVRVCYIYVDTLKVFTRQWVDEPMKQALRDTGCRHVEAFDTRADLPYLCRLEIQGPRPATFVLVAKMFPGHIIGECHPASDYKFASEQDNATFRQGFNALRTQNWRTTNARTGRAGTTFYGAPRKPEGSTRKTRRNYTNYEDDPLTHHFEPRFTNASTCNDNGLRTTLDLLRADKLAALFRKHFRFTAFSWGGLETRIATEAGKIVRYDPNQNLDAVKQQLWNEVIDAIQGRMRASDTIPSAQDMLDSHWLLRERGVAVHQPFFDLSAVSGSRPRA